MKKLMDVNKDKAIGVFLVVLSLGFIVYLVTVERHAYNLDQYIQEHRTGTYRIDYRKNVISL